MTGFHGILSAHDTSARTLPSLCLTGSNVARQGTCTNTAFVVKYQIGVVLRVIGSPSTLRGIELYLSARCTDINYCQYPVCTSLAASRDCFAFANTILLIYIYSARSLVQRVLIRCSARAAGETSGTVLVEMR